MCRARRFLALIGITTCVTCAGGVEALPDNRPWRELILSRVELPAEHNALTRWRPLWSRLVPENSHLVEQLQATASPVGDPAAVNDVALGAWLESIEPTLADLVIRDGEALQLTESHGPETPFPDHQPLRRLALVRLASLKVAWLDGRPDHAVQLALENLALARAMLVAQEGLVPLIQSTGIWQLALDGVYWLVQQDGLSASGSLRLKAALANDDKLASDALIRAFRGEFTFFTRLVIDRLPKTRDVDVLLSAINSFGLAPAVRPKEGELNLAPPPSDREPLNREATLQAAADDISGWITAFGESRHPRGFTAQHTRARLQTYARELGALLRYATEDIPPTPDRIGEANTVIATVENPVGKLFLVIATSQWEPLSALVFRREAQRRAMLGLLAWRQFGRPATWADLVAAGLLAAPPQDPFGDEALRLDLSPPRIWSVGANGIDDGGNGDGQNLGTPDDYTWPARCMGPLPPRFPVQEGRRTK